MGAFESVAYSFRHFADFKSRASRSEFWIFFFFVILLNLVAGTFGIRISGIVALVLFVPQLSVAVRRLHDVGCSGKELIIPFALMFAAGLLAVFPGFLSKMVTLGVIGTALIFFAALLRHLVKEGSRVPNKWGASPTAFSFAR
ncbi:DUF805 domain-containing protein [Sphingomonas sp. LHG3406-1]|uniref:DUF805 domain-containing protein n=1 Tax=Sphingomonas sp. LHG3406-1 TaxID=2804617 RepID=UPI0026150120|nr:DUF805 domain-containing protein [Sphingomonas sp. LHG3406-1]